MTDTENIIVTAHLKSAFVAYAMTFFMVVVFCVILNQILLNDKTEIEWWFLLFGVIILSYMFFLLFRQQFKNLTIYQSKIEIKPLFSIAPKTISYDNLKGWELYETTIIGGLGYNIRLLTKANKSIVFPQDNYSNYDKLIQGFHKSKLAYLGQKEFKNKYKNAYKFMLKWSAILLPVIYGIFLLLKAAKL